MIKDFKQLLVKIAGLSRADQRWILAKLSAAQRQRFEQLGGERFLTTAQHFSNLKIEEALRPTLTPPPLPGYYEALRQQEPLYIALVLEQGNYAWLDDFLSCFDQEGEIRAALDQGVARLKPATKKIAYELWQKRLSFEQHLENADG